LLTRLKAPFEVQQSVERLGENIRAARVRRRMSQDQLAQACHITRKTLYAIEKGAPGIGIGTIYTVLWALGLLPTAAHMADPDSDEHGKILEAARQPKRVRQATDNDF
jgi:DNA-binding XRE family transcriptional regulator